MRDVFSPLIVEGGGGGGRNASQGECSFGSLWSRNDALLPYYTMHPHLIFDGWNVTKFKVRANIESKPILSSLMFPSPQNVKIHLISVRTKRRELRSETAANPCQNGQKRRRSWRRRQFLT